MYRQIAVILIASLGFVLLQPEPQVRIEAIVGCSPDAGALFEPAVYVHHREGIVVAESLFQWFPAVVDPGDVEDRRDDHLRLVAALISRNGEIESSTLYPHPETGAAEPWQIEQAAAVNAILAQYRNQSHVLLGEEMLQEFGR